MQCFDYDNFIEINLRRPSWRCPQCDQSICYTDMRIDQLMVKVNGIGFALFFNRVPFHIELGIFFCSGINRSRREYFLRDYLC